MIDQAYAFEQYEALRRQALDAPLSARSGLGLTLFLSRGMGAWWAALSALAPQPPRPSAYDGDHSAARISSSQRPELVAVLAGMVMACSKEMTP